MTTLVRWNPTHDIRSMNREMDRLMNAFFGTPVTKAARPTWGLALDITEDDSAYTLSASMPGISPEDVEITVEDKVLTIKGETKTEQASAEENENSPVYRIRERRYGKFSRSVSLPKNVNVDAIEAKQENGVLTLTLPKVEEAQPKRITIS